MGPSVLLRFSAGLLLLSQLSDFVEAKRWETYKSLWPGAVIPYQTSKSVQFTDSKGELQGAMDEIHSNTCIRFVPRTNEEDFVQISAGLDCHTPIGKKGKEQVLVVQIPFCLERRKLLRQLLRVLGLPNEQSRPDRDQYITINLSNVAVLDAPIFAKLNATELDLPLDDLPYDYNSIMHADAEYKALNNTIPTIIPLENGVTVGKATGLSSVDIMKLNLLYC
ncbi:high choriolytic enzyme 1-like [Paramacrobiotus metropolitanus]|uniref:high choriolytic enzyme 1-like n=1 Tax=Paramacrobiotus metropolitanus TaxID=2943436 RepID=UPI0024462D2A|nr:high choriolytic enzyme 1-like [Paramacrobiotus metropolitanus]